MNDWITSATRPKYKEKTITYGAATIVIYRPILSEAEAAKAQEKTRAALESAMLKH